jgi:hypothetical protein
MRPTKKQIAYLQHLGVITLFAVIVAFSIVAKLI